MIDPTYNISDIKKNPLWYTAWIISECLNDNAPLGWSKYIWIAEEINKHIKLSLTQEIKSKKKR